MNAFILVLVLYGAASYRTVAMQEFADQAACEAARQWISTMARAPYALAGSTCVPKASR